MKQGGAHGVTAPAERHPEGEFAAVIEINLPGEGDIPIPSAVVFPIHFQVVGQIGPAVAAAYITAGKLAELALRPDRKIRVVTIGEQEAPPFGLNDLSIVVPASYFQMRGTDDIKM